MVTPDSGAGLAALSAAVLVGSVLLVAGAGTLLSLLFFPEAALSESTPLASYSRGVQILSALAVLVAGGLLAGVPIGRAVAEMAQVRAEADAEAEAAVAEDGDETE